MTSKYKLTEGALQTIMNGGDVVEPVLQVLGCKKISSNSSDKERYRLLVSDGQNTISFAMLTTQINDRVGAGGTQIYSVIRLKRYITNLINSAGKGDTRVLLILDMDLVASGDVVGQSIGTPMPLTDHGTPNSQTSSIINKLPSASGSSLNMVNMKGDRANASLSKTEVISPIASLSPFHNNWVIKARISNKTCVRTWSNQRGEGKLFSVDLIDESGEIRCTAFKELVDKFFDYLEVDRVYYVSKAQLKPTNRQFCTLKNEFEMTLTSDSVIEECFQNSDEIPQVKYDFVSIDKVASMETDTLVDVIGVCRSTSNLQSFTSKSNREMKKKEVVLVDQSKTAISLTLWGLQAETFDGSNNPVVLIKGAKVAEFAGNKHLSTIMSSQFKVNPNIAESYRLRSWYEIEGAQSEVRNVSERSGIGSLQTAWKTIKEAQEQGLGQSGRGDYYQTVGTVLLTRADRLVYKACPGEECNKKVTDMENGMYRCEKCNREYPNFKYRLLVSMNIGDSSSNQWVTLFSSEAEKIMGKSSQEIGAAVEEDPEVATKIFEDINYKQFVFKCRAKIESYNDEQRLKTVVIKVDPVNYEEYSGHLLEKIQKFIS